MTTEQEVREKWNKNFAENKIVISLRFARVNEQNSQTPAKPKKFIDVRLEVDLPNGEHTSRRIDFVEVSE